MKVRVISIKQKKIIK